MAAAETPLLSISSFTFSKPILSSLSIATVISISLSASPITSTIPDSTFLLLSLMIVGNFNSENTVSYNCISSTSNKRESEPTTSASH